MKTCTRCGIEQPESAFQKRGNYRLRFCKTCLNASHRERYRSDTTYAEERRLHAHRYRRKNPEHVNAKKAEWCAANPEKMRKSRKRTYARLSERWRVYQAVKEAIADGRLLRQPCHCGATRVHAHHHRGYAPEHVLDVIWLCQTHHSETHRRYDQAIV